MQNILLASALSSKRQSRAHQSQPWANHPSSAPTTSRTSARGQKPSVLQSHLGSLDWLSLADTKGIQAVPGYSRVLWKSHLCSGDRPSAGGSEGGTGGGRVRNWWPQRRYRVGSSRYHILLHKRHVPTQTTSWPFSSALLIITLPAAGSDPSQSHLRPKQEKVLSCFTHFYGSINTLHSHKTFTFKRERGEAEREACHVKPVA